MALRKKNSCTTLRKSAEAAIEPPIARHEHIVGMATAAQLEHQSPEEEELVAQQLLKKLPEILKRYTDKERAERYLRALFEGMRPSPFYADDPVGDPCSLYLKRIIAGAEIAVDIAQNSDDARLEEARLLLRDLKNQLPKGMAWLMFSKA